MKAKLLFMIFGLFIPLLEALENQLPSSSFVWSCEQMMRVKQVEDVQTSFDGKYAFFTVLEAHLDDNHNEYRRCLYVTSMQTPELYERPFGDQSCSFPQWSPTNLQIAILVPDLKGCRQIWLIDLVSKRRKQITQFHGDIISLKWSPDGRRIAFAAQDPVKEKGNSVSSLTKKHLPFTRLWLLNIETSSFTGILLLDIGEACVTSFTPYMGGGGFDWSPDGKEIAVTVAPTNEIEGWKKSFIALIDVENQRIKRVIQNQTAAFSPVYSPDGYQIAYLAAFQEAKWPLDFRVFVEKRDNQQKKILGSTKDNLPSKIIGWSSDSQTIYIRENQRSFQSVQALSMNGKISYDVTPPGTVFSEAHLNASKNLLGLNIETVNKPVEAYIMDLKKGHLKQISRVNQAFLKDSILRTELVYWRATDGLEIEGLLTYPAHYQTGKKYPLILSIHGGPLCVFSQHFIANPSIYGPIAALAEEGYAVLRCNVRGSTGYGKLFRYANYQDWGGKDCSDLLEGVNHLIKLGIADEKKLGLIGWSYGGYLALWIMARTNRFRAAVVGAAICNCSSFAKTTDVPGFLPDYFGFSLEQNSAFYQHSSPLFYLQSSSTPTLIQHGLADRRVPISQSEELYQRLRQQKIPVRMVVYPDMEHHPFEPKEMLHLLRCRLQWFSFFIKNQS